MVVVGATDIGVSLRVQGGWSRGLERLAVEAGFQHRLEAAVRAGIQRDRTPAGRFQSLRAVTISETKNPQARAVTELRDACGT